MLSLDLAKRLLRKGFSWEKIERILIFLRSYVNFENPEIFLKFDEQIDILTNKKQVMGIKELVLQLREEQGVEKGMEQGMERGIEKAKAAIITNLLLKTNHSLQEIADLADVSIDYVIEVKNNLPSAVK